MKQYKGVECFDKYAAEYENWFEDNSVLYKEELQALKDLIGNVQNGLEIGMGSGRFSLQPNISMGVEPSKNMREIALRKGLNAIEGIAESLPIENETFDFAVMMTSICFVQDVQKALDEALRVIKKNGFLIIGFIDKESKLAKQIAIEKEKSKFYGEATLYSTAEIVEQIKKAGFKSFEIYDKEPISFIKCFK